MRIFVEVYRQKSFSKASEKLYLSQPTVSEHIKSLEFELGCSLFDRLGRSIIPTKEAEILFPRALSVLEQVERLKEEITTAQDEVKGQLTIGASTIPGTYILPLIAAKFKKKYPQVSFEILIEDSRKITDMVLNHELIMGVVGAVMEPEKLNYVPFIEDELILVATDRIINKETMPPSELRSIPFVIREPGSGTRNTMERFLKTKDLPIEDLNIVATLGSTDSVKQALKASLGASILSKYAVEDELKSGVLKEIKLQGFKMKRHFSIITHKKRTLPNPYNTFYEFLISYSPESQKHPAKD